MLQVFRAVEEEEACFVCRWHGGIQKVQETLFVFRLSMDEFFKP